MKPLDILQTLIDDLMNKKIKFIIIPCDRQFYAQQLMMLFQEKGIVWRNGEIPGPSDCKIQAFDENTAYALSIIYSRLNEPTIAKGEDLPETIKVLNDRGMPYTIIHAYGLLCRN